MRNKVLLLGVLLIAASLVIAQSVFPPAAGGGGGPAAWGDITGTLADQTDLSAPSTDGCIGFICRKTVTLTDAQIKALGGGTPVQIVAAPGVNQAIVPILISLRCAAIDDYTNIEGTSALVIKVGNTAIAQFSQELFSSVSGILAPGDPADAQNGFVSFTQLSLDAGANETRGYAGIYDSDIENQTLTLGSNNGSDFTGGNAANTLTVTVLYSVVPL